MTARSASHAVSADRARDRQFCETEYAALIGYCFRLTGDGELTRDVVQEAFVRVLARATWPANPHGYLYATATNLVRRHWRRERRERSIRHLLVTRERGAPVADTVDVRRAVADLPPRLAQVVALHYFGDQPLAQIATTLGVPPGTVKRRLHEARNRLGAAAQLAPLKEGSDE